MERKAASTVPKFGEKCQNDREMGRCAHSLIRVGAPAPTSPASPTPPGDAANERPVQLTSALPTSVARGRSPASRPARVPVCARVFPFHQRPAPPQQLRSWGVFRPTSDVACGGRSRVEAPPTTARRGVGKRKSEAGSVTNPPASRASAELGGEAVARRGVASGGGGRCDWPSVVATATIGPCGRSEVSGVAAVGIQKWRVWCGVGGCRSPERACSASRAGERTPVPGAPASCSFPLHPLGTCGTELDMEPQVSRGRRGFPVPESRDDGRPPLMLTRPRGPAGLGPACPEGEGLCDPK